MASQPDSMHFDVVLSPSANHMIEEAAKRKKISASEILTQAIALYLEVEKLRKPGQTVGLLDSDKKPVAEFLVPDAG